MSARLPNAREIQHIGLYFLSLSGQVEGGRRREEVFQKQTRFLKCLLYSVALLPYAVVLEAPKSSLGLDLLP